MRSSQRRNSQQDDTPGRTRAGRGGKATSSRSEVPEPVPPKLSPSKLSPGATRKTTRSASNISGRSFEAAGEVYASYERPLLMVFGLPVHFFESLKKHHGKLPKDRKVLVGSLALRESALEDDESDDDQESDSGSESSEPPIVVQPISRGRGRGRGGGRGGRGRGGRGRGRGRGRGGIASAASPARARSSRTSAPNYSLPEDDEDSSTQESNMPGNSGLDTPTFYEPLNEHDMTMEERIEAMAASSDDDGMSLDGADDIVEQSLGLFKVKSATPHGTPSADNLEQALRVAENAMRSRQPSQTRIKAPKKTAIPRIALQKGSGTQTPRTSASTPAEIAVPKLLDPEEDALSDSDLPGPWIEDLPSPVEGDCEDRADYLLQTRYKPMIDVQDLIARLTKFNPAQRSTESLEELAANTQYILKAWQDQYLTLDARVSIT